MKISTRFYNSNNIENYLNKMYKTRQLTSLSDKAIFQVANNPAEEKRIKQIRQLLDNKLFFNFVNAFSDKINQPLTLDSLPSDLFNLEYYYATNLRGVAEPGWCVKITENYEQEINESKTAKLRSYTENGYMINVVNNIHNIENYKCHIGTHFTLEIPGNQYFKPQMHKTIIAKNLTEINNFLRSTKTDLTKLKLIIVNEVKNDTDTVISRKYKLNPETNLIEPDQTFVLNQYLEENDLNLTNELNHLTQDSQVKFENFGAEQKLDNYWIDKATKEALERISINLNNLMQANQGHYASFNMFKDKVNADFAIYFQKLIVCYQQEISDKLDRFINYRL